MKLYPHQSKLIDGARSAFRSGKKSVLIVLSTGGGKSVIIGDVVRGLVTNNKRVLVLAHRARLINQLNGTLSRFDVSVSRIAGAKKVRNLCMLGMVETVRRRLDRLPDPDYIIVDEAHHSLSDQYLAVLKQWPNVRVIGVTATPARTDGKGLGDVYECMIEGPPMAWLKDNGFLANYRYFRVPSHIDLDQIKKDKKTGDYNEKELASAERKSHIVGDAISHYKEHASGLTGIVFCTGIARAKEVAEDFCAAGIVSDAIDGTMDEDVQESLMGDLASGKIKLLMSADLIGEGVDVPSINVVIMLRPTQSVTVFLQQAGRALRVKADGSMAIILDHVQNVKRHGLPCDPRAWSLDTVKKQQNEITTRQCVKCQRVFNAFTAKDDAATSCAESPCPVAEGQSRPVVEQVVEVIDDNLVEATNQWEWAGDIRPEMAHGAELEDLIARADTEEKLKQIARARGYKSGWWVRQAELKGLRRRANRYWQNKGK